MPSLQGTVKSYATMFRDERYKLVVYHTHDKGELYDLENDPWEFENLWHDSDSSEREAPAGRGGLQRHHGPGRRLGWRPDRRNLKIGVQ